MKQSIIFICLLFSFMVFHLTCVAQITESFKKVEVERYSYKPAKEFQFIKLHSEFGSAQLINLSQLDSLKNKKIFSVKLVYTKYRESESFNQEQLNKKRVQNLIAQNPKLFSNEDIHWYLVEQTAIDSSVAKDLFHGFYIVYKNKAPQRNYALNSNVLNTGSLIKQTFNLKSSKEATFIGKEGTQIKVKANSFLDENNKLYNGDVVLELKEAITLESMILGNLVTVSDGLALESGGMVYVDAKSIDGKILKLNPKKPMEISVKSKGNVKPEMKLWKAENAGAFINWTSPEALNQPQNSKKIKNNLEDRISTPIEGIDWDTAFLGPEQVNKRKAFDEIKLRLQEGFIESLRITNFNNSKIDDYYMLYGNGNIRVIIYKTLGPKNEIVLADTIFNAAPFHNSKKPLPLPVIAKRKDFDSVFYQNNHLVWGRTRNLPVPNIAINTYAFNFMQLGQWANIDRLASDKRTQSVEFFASLPENTKFTDLSIYLVFKNEKIFIPGYKSNKFAGYGFSHGDYEIPQLPIGAQAYVLCVCKKNDQHFVDIKPVTITKKQNIKLVPMPSTEDQIRQLIAGTF